MLSVSRVRVGDVRTVHEQSGYAVTAWPRRLRRPLARDVHRVTLPRPSSAVLCRSEALADAVCDAVAWHRLRRDMATRRPEVADMTPAAFRARVRASRSGLLALHERRTAYPSVMVARATQRPADDLWFPPSDDLAALLVPLADLLAADLLAASDARPWSLPPDVVASTGRDDLVTAAPAHGPTLAA